MGAHAVSEKPYELACEASIRAIENQAAIVEGLRSRAGTILAATALVTSFFGGQALTRAEKLAAARPLIHDRCARIVHRRLVAVVDDLLPFTLQFSLSAGAIVGFFEDSVEESRISAAEALREVALQYELMVESNVAQIHLLVVCFRLAIVCLVGEVGFWLTALARGGL